MLERGQRTFEFTVSDHEGNEVRLQDFLSRNVVPWFYRKADTAG